MVSTLRPEKGVPSNPSWTDLGLPNLGLILRADRKPEKNYPTELVWGSVEFRQLILDQEAAINIPGAWAYRLAHVFPEHSLLRYSEEDLQQLEQDLSDSSLQYPPLAPGEKIDTLVHHNLDELRKRYPDLTPSHVVSRLAIVLGLIKYLYSEHMAQKTHSHLSDDETVHFSRNLGYKLTALKGKSLIKREARKAVQALLPSAGRALIDRILNQFTFHEKEMAAGKKGVPLVFLQEQMFIFPSGKRLLVRMRGSHGQQECQLHPTCNAAGTDLFELIDPDNPSNEPLIVGDLSLHYLKSGFPQGNQTLHSRLAPLADLLDFEDSQTVSFPLLELKAQRKGYYPRLQFDQDHAITLPGKAKEKPVVDLMWLWEMLVRS